MRCKQFVAPIAVAVALLGTEWARAGHVSFQGLGFVSSGVIGQGPSSRAHGVSADGSTVVGMSRQNAFRWTEAGGMQNIVPVPLLPTVATAVSADGTTVVGVVGHFAGESAFRWTVDDGITGASMNPLIHGNAVSADGTVVVGAVSISSIPAIIGAAVWTLEGGGAQLLAGQSTATGISADGTVIVGFSGGTTSSGQAFRWTADEGLQALGFSTSHVVISGDGGAIAGYSGHLWTEEDGLQLLDFSPRALSADGSVIVGVKSSRAYLWSESNGGVQVDDFLLDHGVNLDGWTLREATGVSADGRTIVGWGVNPQGRDEAWRVQIVPEPGTWVLAAMALGGLPLACRARCSARRRG